MSSSNGPVPVADGSSPEQLLTNGDTGSLSNGHTFDPNATPQQKAAAAGKARDKLRPVNDALSIQKPDSGREVKLDTGNSQIIPTINVQHAEDGEATTSKEKDAELPSSNGTPPDEDSVHEDDSPQSPGALPALPTPLPDWYKVGWRQVSGIDDVTDDEQKEVAFIEEFVSDQYYGAWYHNAGIIIFAVLATHFLTRFHFGFGWLFIVLAVCSTYYSTSVRRVRRNARDDIQRELVKTRLMSEHESAEWINSFLDRFWLIYEPVLSTTIVSSVDQVLSSNTPTFLDSIRLSHFTLGNKAPHIDKVRTFPKTENDIVMMDWGISFTPNDISDLTPRQAQARTNPKIILSVRVGKGLATAAMPIVVEDITFSGLMRIRLKLMTNFPHIQLVDICFLEKPVIDYVLKPVGGESLGFDIANIPGLSSFIRDTTHSILGPMMYDPNVFTLNLEQMLSGAPLDTAIGVLQITIDAARGIQGAKLAGGTPDPYVSITIQDRAELAKTKYKHNTYNPSWSETKFILINNLHEDLILNVLDYNDKLKDTRLGSVKFALNQLEEDAIVEGITSPILRDGKPRGELRFDVSFYPVLTPEEGSDELPDTNVGIVRLTLHQAKDLDTSKSMSGDLNPLAKLFVGDTNKAIFETAKFKHTDMPVWEASHEFLCANKENSVILVKVIDDRDFLKDPLLGYMSIKLTDLLEAKKEGKDWFPLSKCKSGKIRVSAEWKPLNMAGSLHGADTYTPPIGVVRLLIDKATDVKNVEAALGGKSDPYVRVQVNGDTRGRTEVINNNLNPVWDAIIYVPVHSSKETLFLECMDYQHLTKDRSLGSVDLMVADLMKESSDPKYLFESTGPKEATDPIRLDKGNEYKGHLHYKAEFIPAINLRGVKFDSGDNEILRAAKGDSDDEGVVHSSGSSMSSSDVELHDVPEGVTISPMKRVHKKGAKSTDTARTAETTASAATGQTTDTSPVTAADAEDGKISMTTDELLTQQSGVIVFSIQSGILAKKGRLEVLLDDAYWPAFSTAKARSVHAEWQTVGEGFLKELDFGRVWFRLNEADEGDKDDIVAEWKGDAKPFLRSTLEGPQRFTLRDPADETRGISTVTVESRYVPVPVTLEPRESINNQGLLRVDLLNARNLPAADRSGKSDPYAVFSLNDQKVFKSQTKKQTLDPDWNESFVVSVPSRVKADFLLEVYDWDQFGSSDFLGRVSIDLAALEPFEASEQTLLLTNPKGGSKGQVTIRMNFQPEIIVKSRKNTSTFSTAGRALTTVGGLPVTAGKGVIHGVTGIFKGDKSSTPEIPHVPAIPSGLPSGQASRPVGTLEGSHAQFPSSDDIDAQRIEPGTLTVTVHNGHDIADGDAKPYVTLRLGDKEYKTKHVGRTNAPQWEESFTFTASGLTPKLYLWVHNHKTIGKDILLGDGEVDIWRHVNPKTVPASEVSLELRDGNGLIHLKLEYSPELRSSPANDGRSSVSSERVVSRTVSISQPSPKASRFSLSRRRQPVEAND